MSEGDSEDCLGRLEGLEGEVGSGALRFAGGGLAHECVILSISSSFFVIERWVVRGRASEWTGGVVWHVEDECGYGGSSGGNRGWVREEFAQSNS